LLFLGHEFYFLPCGVPFQRTPLRKAACQKKIRRVFLSQLVEQSETVTKGLAEKNAEFFAFMDMIQRSL
jgi:hypothetical protein